MHSGKVVLISTSGYNPARDDGLLLEFIEDRIELFCAVGVDADKWEDALDWLCVGPDGSGGHYITTSSHPGETEADVVDFARSFSTEREHEVEIVRV